MLTVDRWGRRPLLMISFLIGLSCYLQDHGEIFHKFCSVLLIVGIMGYKIFGLRSYTDEMDVSEKWISHYSSKHKILIVGEGNFSFALSLASAFGSAINITATSLDSEDELDKKYMDAMDNVYKLKRLGCHVQHEVDVHTMSFDNSLSLPRYDRIVFNFPHAGSRFFGRENSSRAIEGHKVLVQGFLENAKEMLKEEGEIHITHKTTYPFSDWEIKSLAKAEGLKLIKESVFELGQYPGYVNKRGSGGRRSSDTFPVGQCSTLMFINPYLV